LVACSSLGVINVWDLHASTITEEVGGEDAEKIVPKKKKRRNGSNDTRENVMSCKQRSKPLEPVLRIIPNHQDNSKGNSTPKGRGILYNLKIISLQNQPYLLVCGEHGISLYKWQDTVSYVRPNYTQTISLKADMEYKPHLLVSPFDVSLSSCYSHAEINSMDYDDTSSTLYGASGDALGCYKWDLESGELLGTFGRSCGGGGGGGGGRYNQKRLVKGHHGYLHCVKVVPSVMSGGANTVLTGGEDGKMGVWNGKEGKLIELIHCKSAMDQSSSTNSGTVQTDHDETIAKWGNSCHIWVSALDVGTTGNWAYVCGGANQSVSGSGGVGGYNRLSISSNRSSMSSVGSNISSSSTTKWGSSQPSSTGGFVSLWNLPTRTLSSAYATRETIQDVCYCCSFGEDDYSKPQLVTVANEGVVSYWSPSKIERAGRSWLSIPSAYSVCVSGGEMAVGGMGETIDCFASGFKSKSYSFEFM